LAGANPATVSSKAIVMNITPKVTPSVRIASTPAAFCEGSSVTVSGTVTNGGNAAQLTWLVNGKTAGSAAVLALASLKQSDTVMLELKSSATCAEPSIVRSAPLTFTVYPLPPEPTVAFAKGTLTAIIGGGTLTVQWYRNNTLIDGATNTTYEPKENGDYSVSVTNEWGCVSRSSAISVVLSGVEDDAVSDFRVIPNPFNADVHIIPATDIPNAEVRITDGLGRNVVTVRNARLSAGTAWRLPLGPELASGVYHVHVESESRQTVLRCFKR
ncbi:MAG: T9SS type A sorting domain-containing protein, partial [Candidatus Kapaibacterium sp.]